ncbi:MAG TPA: hypothetical protein VOA41_13605 [Candidatus Dormibacteraeota bacterium]|nr:hypothetical protein [Candidatus Dormibacteraeota bacterium]
MKKSAAVLGVITALLVLAGFYLWGPSSAPPGQKPLSTLSSSNFGDFTETFDSPEDFPRVLLLLSPT